MIEVEVTYSKELDWRMLTDLKFIDSTLDKDKEKAIKASYAELDSTFIDQEQLDNLSTLLAKRFNVDKDDIKVKIKDASVCVDC